MALGNLGFAANAANLDPVRGQIRFVDWYVANEAWWQDILRRKGDLQVAWPVSP